MKKYPSFLFGVLVMLGAALATGPLAAQQSRRSPHETISAVVDGNRITVTYGRPYIKDPRTGEPRKIWGGLVPFGKVWRTGADEATMFVTQKALVIGGANLPAGAYTLYSQPEQDGTAKLIVTTSLGQWGIPYEPGHELARIDLKRDLLENTVEQFTIAIEKNPAGGGVLKLQWEKTQFSVPFTVAK
jgi:hypothetical protein